MFHLCLILNPPFFIRIIDARLVVKTKFADGLMHATESENRLQLFVRAPNNCPNPPPRIVRPKAQGHIGQFVGTCARKIFTVQA